MNDYQFDTTTIRENCEAFYALYRFTEGGVRQMCELKLIHTRAVAQNCLEIADGLGLSDYDRDMAWVIGQLHDFARFGQAVVTHSLDDSAQFNHAQLGARLLFTHGLIRDIIPDYDQICPEDQRVMEMAVLHHSDLQLPDDLTARERLFCRIIREADQLDIFRTIVESGWEINYGCTRAELLAGEISPAIEAAFYRHILADYSMRVTPADFHMAHIALCFGLESASARRRAAEQGYLQRMMEIRFTRPDVQKRYAGMKAEVEAFLREDQ